MNCQKISAILFFLGFCLGAFGHILPTLESDTGFKTVEITKDVFYKNMPYVANESSGLIFWDDLLWTHNDSDGKAAIYGFDTIMGSVKRAVYLNGADNFDWEDIAQDAGYIYIGDFGNNSGSRRTMFIYKIAKGGITGDKDEVFVPVQKIAFTFDDRENFKQKQHEHNYDCEAFFAFENHLYLFTKNWADQKTRLYKMPKKIDKYQLQPEATFDAGGLITGADISSSGKRVALLGYIDFVPFMWLFWDFEGDDFFGGKKLRAEFPEMVFVQTEGIAFSSGNELLFSCEESAVAPSVFKVLFSDLINDKSTLLEDEDAKMIVPGKIEQSGRHDLLVSFEVLVDAGVKVELLNQKWKVVDEITVPKSSDNQATITFDTKDLRPGTYFINFILQNYPDNVVDNPSHENSVWKKIEIEK